MQDLTPTHREFALPRHELLRCTPTVRRPATRGNMPLYERHDSSWRRLQVIIHCPSCSYSRRPSDIAPPGSCPECGVVFCEFLAKRSAHRMDGGANEAPQRGEVPKRPIPPAAPVAKTTNCPACGGLVAYGAKTCPHCGKSKPAPEPPRPPTKVTKTHLVLAALLLLAISMSIGNQPEPLTGDQVARICAREIGVDPNSSRALTMQDLRAMDACISRYGFKTKP